MTAGWAVLLVLLGLWPGSANPPQSAGINVAPPSVSAVQFEQDQRQALTLERSV